jgi:histidinol dehydrogenase
MGHARGVVFLAAAEAGMPSHILPTAGTARFFSPLGVDDFMRRMSVISYSREALRSVSSEVKLLAHMEGLDAHAQAVRKREH